MTYQSHDGTESTSASARKLERINLPQDLSGKSVLDIGCNEGFFCAEAHRRGATNVVGIDIQRPALEFARSRYGSLPGVSFEERRWTDLPRGPFDVVLWLSAMHYELDPARIFSLIKRELAPNGLFILECGVYPVRDIPMMVPFPRPNDRPIYPTHPALRNMLSGWSCREVAAGEKVPGDDTPRHVFHCRPALPTVMLVVGNSESGKSTFTHLVDNQATKTIALDRFLTALWHSRYQPTPLDKFVKERCDPNNLERLFKEIDEAGFTDEYINLLVSTIVPTDGLVIIEGYTTPKQSDALIAKLRGKAIVWSSTRAA
jgi:SAM-dependent methyltransferase